MRRRAGVGAIQRQKIQQEKFKEKGNEIQENQLEQLRIHMEKFQDHLKQFASKYKHQIKKNSTFRRQFQEMCASIGVDPLASGKGFWCEVLGVGDFYYELGVQIVELGVATSHRNGGVLSFDEVIAKLNGRRKADSRISDDDIIRAVKQMQVLGSGLEVVDSGKTKFVYSIPGELSMDHTVLLQKAETTGFVTTPTVCFYLNWTKERAERAIEHLLRMGVAWQDDYANPTAYWFPAFFKQQMT